jgi:hypothetical protein
MKEGQIIEIPFIGKKIIGKEEQELFLLFKLNDLNDFIKKIRQFPVDPHVLDSRLRTLIHICYLDDFLNSKIFFKKLFEAEGDILSLQILQVFSHRIYENEGFSLDLKKVLESTVTRSICLNLDKWKISGKFFLGFYSQNKVYAFRNYMDCLNPDNCIDYDCLIDKIVYIINWLRFFYPLESNKKIKKFLEMMWEKTGPDYILFFLLTNHTSISAIDESDFDNNRNTFISKKILIDIYSKNSFYKIE